MKVEFIEIENPEKINYKINWQRNYSDFPLSINKKYTVYAIEYFDDKHINFFILDDGGNTYPNNYPSDFFKIIDNRLSACWINKGNNLNYPLKNVVNNTIITFKEWIENKYFEYELFENLNNSTAIFDKYKIFMDCEYPDESFPEAIVIINNWVMCSYCSESWETKDHLGIIICPKCNKKNNNPFWDNR